MGFEGGAGGRKAPVQGFRVNAPDICFPPETYHIFASIFVSIVGQFFGTCFFTDGFLFPVKELRLLTNPCHWVRVLDVVGSYMYIVL